MSGMDLGSIYSSLDLRLDRFEVGINNAVKGFYKLQLDTQRASNIMDTSVTTAVNNISKSYDIWNRANEKTGRGIFDNSRKIDSFKQQIGLLDEEIKKSDAILVDIERQCGKNSEEAEKYRSRVLGLRDAQSRLTQEMREAERQTGTFRGRLQLLETEFARIDDRYKYFGKIGKGISDIGNNLTMKLTLPIVALGAASAKSAMDFEYGMAKVNTIANLGGEDINKLSKETLNLSNSTGVAAKDLAEMEYSALSASVSIKDLTSVVKTSSSLAKGGFADANDSLRLLTSTYNVYREDFEKMGISQAEASQIIADKMIAIQNLGETTVAKLAQSMGQLTPIAKAAGANLDEIGAGMIVLTKNGVETGEAVTGLKAMFSNLIKPSEQARKMAQSIGLEFSSTAIKTKGLGGFLGDLREKLKGASPALLESADNVSKFQYAIDHATKEQKKNKEQMREWQSGLKQAKGEMKVLTKSGGETVGVLGQLFGSVEGLSAVLSMTSKYGMKDFQDGMKACKESAGSTQKAAEMMEETTSEKFTKGMNKLKNVGIELGVKMLPTVEKVVGMISKLADKFNALSPSMQDNILKIALITAAAGPLLSITGKGISSIGTLLGAGKKIGTFFGLFRGATVAVEATSAIGTAATVATGASAGGGILGLTASLGPLAAAALPWAAGAAAIAGGGYLIYKQLSKDATPAVDLFNNKIKETRKYTDDMGRQVNITATEIVNFSKSTKEAVGAYVKLNDEASKTLTDFYVNSTKITEKTSKTLIDKYSAMGTQIKDGLNKKYTETYSTMEKFFKDSDALNVEEEKKALKGLEKNNIARKAEIDKYTKEIQKILDKATKANRALTLEEQQSINGIQDKMKTNAIKVLSKEEVESKVILQRIKDYGTRVSSEQAQSIIQNANKQRDGSKKAYESQYDDAIRAITRMRDETHTITADQAKKLIADAKKQKEDSIIHAEQMRNGVVAKVIEMNGEIVKNVDTETGKIFSKFDKIKNSWKDYHPETKYFDIIYQEKYMSSVKNAHSSLERSSPLATGYATGTDSAARGIHEIAENGFEIVTGRQFRFFNGGEKVFNNDKSKDVLETLLGINKPNHEQIAKDAMIQAKDTVTVKARASVSEPVMKSNTGAILSNGNKDKKSYLEFNKFVAKLNEDEVKNSKDMLDKEYKNRVATLDNKIKDLRQYEKEHLSSSKNIDKAEIARLENSKKNLKTNYDLGIDLLKKRSESVKKAIELSENLFKSKMDTYDVAIDKLSKDTKDLNKNLDNQKAIVIIQTQKIDDLKKRYEDLAGAFGSTSDEAISAKKSYEDAKNELVDFGDAVVDAKDKIDKNYLDSVENYVDKIKNALKEKYQEDEKNNEEYLENKLTALEKSNQKSIESTSDLYDKQIKDAEDASNSIIKFNDNKIRALENAERKHDIALKDKDDSDREKELRRLLSLNYSAKKKAELQKELDDLLKTREERKYKEGIDAQKEALSLENENEREALEEKKRNIAEEAKIELKKLKDDFEAEKETLENKLIENKKFYENKLKDANITAEAERLIVDENQKEIVNLLSSYGDKYENVGITLGDKLVCGFAGKMKDLTTLMANTISDIKNSIASDIDFNNIGGSLYIRNTDKVVNAAANNVNNSSSNITKNNIQSLFTAEKVVLGDGLSIQQIAQELKFLFDKECVAKGGMVRD